MEGSTSPTRVRPSAGTPSTSTARQSTCPPLAKGEKARGKRAAASHALIVEQIDAATAAGGEEASPTPAAGSTRRQTRTQAKVEALDDAIAELFYGENLPGELADSARFHKLLKLMRSAPAGYEAPTRNRLDKFRRSSEQS